MLYSPSAGSILVFLRRNQPHSLDTNYFQNSDNLNINVSNLRVKPQFSEDTTNKQTQSSGDSTNQQTRSSSDSTNQHTRYPILLLFHFKNCPVFLLHSLKPDIDFKKLIHVYFM